MTTLDDVRTLRQVSLRMLPGLWQARAQMNVMIRTLEYFARDAEHELEMGLYTPPPVDSQMESDVRVLQSMLHVFRRINRPRD